MPRLLQFYEVESMGLALRGYMDGDFQIIRGDSLLELPRLEANSVDACVTDPPYELGFMGKTWDSTGIAYNVDLWLEVFRVLKPGAHLVAFGGTRTYHRMACAIEDAGFEIRDQLQWIYGSGFPKSLDVSKAIDKMAGAEREVVGVVAGMGKQNPEWNGTAQGRADNSFKPEYEQTIASTDEAKQWNGWGTALKPANEPICLARKPLEKGLTVAQNVLKWGTGAINVDGCRVETSEKIHTPQSNPQKRTGIVGTDLGISRASIEKMQLAQIASVERTNTLARFPANVIHDGSDEVLEHFPDRDAGGSRTGLEPSDKTKNCYGEYAQKAWQSHGDSGSAARFFYTAKASKYDRNNGLNGFPVDRPDERTETGMGTFTEKGVQPQRNHHPTVKPVDLMRWLCRLVTPPNGTIIDPFLGSGSTAKAALVERFKIIGIEIDAEYARIADARCKELQVKLF